MKARKLFYFMAVVLSTLTSQLMYAQATYGNNTSLGDFSLFDWNSNRHYSGVHNSAVGYFALSYDTSGRHNSALGSNALRDNTSGSFNTAVGSYAMSYGKDQKENTALGYEAMYSNAGSYNTASGVRALWKNSGVYNTANGYEALHGATYTNIGSYNTASGAYALRSNRTGAYNTASGSYALYLNTGGSYNTAMGSSALFTNSTGIGNAAFGTNALRGNTTGVDNTASGTDALQANTTGANNTALGSHAVYSNTTGSNNTAVGLLSLYANTTGFNNTAVGNYALRKNTTGSRNTAIGDSAGAAANASYSTFLGYKTSITTPGLSNVTVIGNMASATASNQVRIGNNSVTSIGGKVGWSTLSDGRFKKNISEDVPGLSFINKLRPVTYTLDIASLDRASGIEEQGLPEEASARTLAANEKHTGFVAQEVEKVAEELGYDFGGIDKPKNKQDHYGLRYAEFVMPLVKAVQELSKENEELKSELADLRRMVLDLKNGKTNTFNLSSAFLETAVPNPSQSSTIIRYGIPEGTASARLLLTNAKGQVLKEVVLQGRGTGQVNLNTSGLPASVYTYTLWVDGKQASSKQLVVTR